MDVTNRSDLTKSLDLWKKQLEADRAKYKKHQTSVLLKQVQKAKAMVARRSHQLAALPGPRAKAVKAALSYVGTVEHPAGSNAGPQIDVWQRNFGFHGQPWCGMFVGSMVEKGGANVTGRIAYTPYIYTDAANHKNGLDGVVWHDGFSGEHVAHTGDLVLFDFGSGGIKHVAMLRAPWKGSGPLKTVEGNTSFGNGGSQDNGGAVALRERDVSLVHSIVRVKWPA